MKTSTTNLDNICIRNFCDHIALTVMDRNPKPSLFNDLQKIEISCDQKAAIDIYISLTPLVDCILQETRFIDIEEDIIIDKRVDTEIDINPSSLLDQNTAAKCQINYVLRFVVKCDRSFVFLSLHSRITFSKTHDAFIEASVHTKLSGEKQLTH